MPTEPPVPAAPADPARHLAGYLALLALFAVHVGEESLTGFDAALADLSGTAWDDRSFTLLIGLVGPAAWVLGARSMLRGGAYGNAVLWFMVVGMLLGEPSHLLGFPVLHLVTSGGGYGYFPGAVTAMLPAVPAVLLLADLLRHRRSGR